MGDNDGLNIHQHAWFHLGKLDKDFSTTYELKDKTNGVYAFVIDGDVIINGEQLNSRDGLGISETDKLDIKTNSEAELLLMEVPMNKKYFGILDWEISKMIFPNFEIPTFRNHLFIAFFRKLQQVFTCVLLHGFFHKTCPAK